jgi:hypothetical protein
MKELDYWINGLMDYWVAGLPGLRFQQFVYSSIQQSIGSAIRHSSFDIPFA